VRLRIFLVACVALLLAIGVRTWLPVERVAPEQLTAPDTRFDYTLTDFSATFRDQHERLELLISGPRLEHEIGQRVGRLSEPRFHIEPDGADWRGRARRGLILREDEELVLEQDIELFHSHADGEIRIVAESLHHHRARRTITSDEPVEIHQAGSWLRAGGLTIRLDDNSIELTNHVQGQLKPAAVEHGIDTDAADGS
jgi:LPS export ABC transporter protein LptC